MADKPEPAIVRVNRNMSFEETLCDLLIALEKAGIIKMEGDYADRVRDGTARVRWPHA